MLSMPTSYLFRSTRLGFRQWQEEDIPALHKINSDPEVMRYFPQVPRLQDTKAFVKRMQSEYYKRGYCYFAVDLLETGDLAGFIGISERSFPSDFTPCADIGWRLARNLWHRGLATEGARRCLQFSFHECLITEVYSLAPAVNLPSQRVMQKIGMQKVKDFDHPELAANPELRKCVLYFITRSGFAAGNAD